MSGFSGGFPDFPDFDPSQPQLTRKQARDRALYRAYRSTLDPEGFAIPESPEEKTNRQLQQAYDATPEFDVGWWGKFGNALAEETVTGQALSNLFDPTFPRTDYVITDEDVNIYASDLPDYVLERLQSETFSFEEWLYEVQQARLTMKRRKEIFSGGVSGTAKGFGAVLLAAGGEAAVFTGIAMAATGALAGPASVVSGAEKISRLQGVARGLGYAGLVDLPLETARYSLDKTLTPLDLVINLGAAFSLGGTIGGIAPGMFQRVKSAAELAAARQGLEAAGDAGARKAAGRSADILDPKISVRELEADDPTAEVLAMSQRELEAEAKRVGVALDSEPRVAADGPDSELAKAYEGAELTPGAAVDTELTQPSSWPGVARQEPEVRGGVIEPGSPTPEIAGTPAVPLNKLEQVIERVMKTKKFTLAELRSRFKLTKKEADALVEELQKRGVVSPKDARGRRTVTSQKDQDLLREIQGLPRGSTQDVAVPSYIQAFVTTKRKAGARFLQSEFGLTKQQADAVINRLEADGIIGRSKSGRRIVLSPEQQAKNKAQREAAQLEAETAGTNLEGKTAVEVKREKETSRLLSGEGRVARDPKAQIEEIENEFSMIVRDGDAELEKMEKEFLELAAKNDEKLAELGRDEWLKWVETPEGKAINQRAENLADRIDFKQELVNEAKKELKSFRRNPEAWLDNQEYLDDIARGAKKAKKGRAKAKEEGRRKVTEADLEDQKPKSLQKSAKEMTEEDKAALEAWQAEKKRLDENIQARIREDDIELQELRRAREKRYQQTGQARERAALESDIEAFEQSSLNLYNKSVLEESDPAKRARALKVWKLWRLANNPMKTGHAPKSILPTLKFLDIGDIDVGLTQGRRALPELPERGPVKAGDPDHVRVRGTVQKDIDAAFPKLKRKWNIARMRQRVKDIQQRRKTLIQESKDRAAADLERRNRELGQKQATVVNRMLSARAIKKKGRERLQQEVIEARKKLSARFKEERKAAIHKGIKDQIVRDFENAPNEAAQRLIAQSFGVSGKVLAHGSTAQLRAATITAAVRTYQKTGKLVKGTVGKPSVKGHKYRKSVTVEGRKINLQGNLEKMLWSLRHSRHKEAKEEIRQFLKSKGFEDPDALAKEFYEKVQAKAKEDNALHDAQGPGGAPELKDRKELNAEVTELKLKSAKRTREDGTEVQAKPGENFMGEADEVDVRLDRDLFEESADRFPNTNIKRSDVDNPSEIDDLVEPPLSTEKDAVIVSDTGEALAEGPSRFAKLDTEALSEEVGTRSYFGHGEGSRETGARIVEELGIPVNRANSKDKVGLITWLGQQFYKTFTPTVYRLMRSKSPFVRKLSRNLLTNPRARGAHSATAVANANYEIAQSVLKKGLRAAENAAAKEGRKLDEILVVHIVRGGSGGGEPEQIAKRAVDSYFKEIFEHAKGAGVFVDGITAIKNYFPRVWAPSKFRRVIEDLGQGDWNKGQEKLTEFLTDAVLKNAASKKAKMSKANAKRVAKKIVSYGINPEAHRDWNSTLSSLRKLKETLVEELEAVQGTTIKGDYDVDDMLELIIPHAEHRGHISFGKQRLGIDELHTQDIAGYGTLRFSDLTDNNLDQITRHYGRQVLGSAEARRLLGTMVDDPQKIEGLSAIVARVKEEAIKAGDDVKEAAFFAKQIEFHFKLLTGQRVYSKEIVKYGTMLNMLSMGTMGMALGIAQIPEIANIFLRTSFSAATNQIDLGDALDIFKMGLRGKTTEANLFSSSIETFTGIGGDINRRDHFMRRMDDLAIDDDFNQGFMGRVLDNGRLFASLNPLGIMPMDTFLRRWASRASFQHFVDTAYKSGPDGKVVLNSNWWNNSKIRFGELGLEAEDIDRLSRVLRNPEYVEVSQGIFGGYKVHNFDFSKVDDHYIIDKFILALRRHTDNMIQRQTPGELPAWMNAGVAKILTQFRVFTIAAKAKQLASGIARGDGKEFANVIGSASLGMLGYSMITYYRALGQIDPVSYFNEKTTTERLIKSGIMRTGYATVFPMLVDLVQFHKDGEGFFDASMRTTGLGIDPLRGSTAFKNYETAKSTLSSLTQRLAGVKNLTQRDVRDAASLIWLTKIPIVNQMFNRAVSDNFPESNR